MIIKRKKRKRPWSFLDKHSALQSLPTHGTRHNRAVVHAPHDEYVWMHGRFVPLSELQSSFASGTPKSGKTLHMLLTLWSTVKLITPGSNRRIVVFDLKGDFTAAFNGMGVPYTLLDLSRDGAAWDVAHDFSSSSAILEICHRLIPDGKGEAQFFNSAARNILYGLWLSFRHRLGRHFTFADIYNAVTADIETQKAILAGHPRGHELIEVFYDSTSEKTRDSIRMTLINFMRSYAPVAAHGTRQGVRPFSLKDFLSQEGILVIRQDLSSPQAMKPFIQAFFGRLVQFVQARPDPFYPPMDFTFIDELETLDLVGLDSLRLAAIYCRSKGMVLNMASQTLSGLFRNGNTENTNAILGCCPFKAYFHTEDPITAERAAKDFGRREIVQTVQSLNYGGETVNCNLSEQIREADVLLTGDILNLPFPNPERGFYGHYRSPDRGYETWKVIPGAEIEVLKPPMRHVPYRRIEGIFEPQPWSDDEYQRCVYGVMPQPHTDESYELSDTDSLSAFLDEKVFKELGEITHAMVRELIARSLRDLEQ